MRIEVEVSTKLRAELVALLETMSVEATDALLTAQIFVEDIKAQLSKTGAPPAGSRVMYTAGPDYWWPISKVSGSVSASKNSRQGCSASG